MAKPAKKNKKRKKRRLRKSFKIALVFLILTGALLIAVPWMNQNIKLKDLGYTQEEIRAIRKHKLTKTILEKQYYSTYLADCIVNDKIRTKYLDLYAVRDEANPLTADDILLYARLLDDGYEEDQLINLFANLRFWEITPLLIFDYQFDEKPYIDDCLAHRDTNSESSFTLSGSYMTPYVNMKEVEKKFDNTVFVNQVYHLNIDDTPADLVPLGDNISTQGQSLRKEAADAFTSWTEAAIDNKTNFFAVASFRSFDEQKTSYQSFLQSMSVEEADKRCARPGHSEHQTGLAVNITPTYENDPDFAATETGKFAAKTCTKYGFIVRYPEGKSLITGMDPEPDHFRYLGIDLANAVQGSHLTYDEFYCLYLKDWQNGYYLPEEEIRDDLYYRIGIETKESSDQ